MYKRGKMKISFILPGFTRHPVGGYKIVFEYANRLSKNGFDVQIVFLNNNRLKKLGWMRRVPLYLATQYEPRWIKLNKNIKKISYCDTEFNQKIKTDIAIATAVETVYPTEKICLQAHKIYFIQDFEDWNVSKKYLYSTYKLGFKNIVIAKWLKDIVDKYSLQPSVYIRNPLDITQYRVFNPIENRNKYTIGMLYHSGSYKGSAETFESLCRLKDRFSELKIIMFGTCDPPKDLPEWVTYYKNASQEQTVKIYNNINIFVCGTIKEGFGLTGLEAMACGATLVTTDYEGAKEYAINGINSLTVPVKDWKNLREKVAYLMMNNDVRMKLANKGIETARNFSWEKAYFKFVNAIMNS